MPFTEATGIGLDRLYRVARELPGILRFRASIWARRLRIRGPVILVYRPAAMGDVLCTFPALKMLRQKYPGCFIVYATNRQYVPLVRMGGVADRVVACEESLLRIHRIVDGDFTMSFRPEYADERGGGGPAIHLVDELAKSLGVEVTDPQPRLTIPADLESWARERFDSLAAPKPVIGIHAGPTWGVRTWPDESWNELVALCRSRLGATVVQFGDTRIIPEMGLRDVRARGAIDWVGQLSVEQTAACVAECDFLVGIDSGLLHVAGAVGTPSVGIFGPTDAARRVPPATPTEFVQANIACAGCHHRRPVRHRIITCDEGVACMKSISAEAVFERVASLLERRVKRSAAALQGSVC